MVLDCKFVAKERFLHSNQGPFLANFGLDLVIVFSLFSCDVVLGILAWFELILQLT